MKLPKVIEDLTTSFEKLPGIGRRSAQRLAFYLLRVPQQELDMFAQSLMQVKRKTKLCKICHNLTEQEECAVCQDSGRDRRQICVVESFQDLLAIEKSGSYRGVYHVLHGAISPLNNIGPQELYLDSLLMRVEGGVREVILATNPSLEGEATALYIADRLEERKKLKPELAELVVTRLGRGLPTGGELEYADDETLSQAMGGRKGVW